MDKRLKQIVTALAVIGLLISIYMTIYKLTENDSMCIGSQGCSVVNASKYSELYGIPVAVLGVIGYAFILGVSLLERKPGFFKDNGILILFGLSLTGFLFNIWLIYVEVALIKAYCPFCIASQITMTIIFILVVTRMIRQP